MKKKSESEILAELSNPRTYDCKSGPDFDESLSAKDVQRLAKLADYALGNQFDRVEAFDKLMKTRDGRLLVLALCRNLQRGAFPEPGPDVKTEAVYAMKALSEDTLNRRSEFPDDISMQSMYMSDASDYLRVASYIERGEIEKAANHAANLDTAAREGIPEEVWDLFRPYL